MRYGDNKPLIIRRVIFAALIVLAAILQNTGKPFSGAFGARAFLLIPLLISISMFEREITSALFGVFAGVLWDISSGCDGFNAVVLMLICAASSLLISHFMRNNIITAVVCGALCVFVYEVLYIFVFIVLSGGGNPLGAVFGFYAPSLILTTVFIPVFYYIVKAVYVPRKTAED